MQASERSSKFMAQLERKRDLVEEIFMEKRVMQHVRLRIKNDHVVYRNRKNELERTLDSSLK